MCLKEVSEVTSVEMVAKTGSGHQGHRWRQGGQLQGLDCRGGPAAASPSVGLPLVSISWV